MNNTSFYALFRLCCARVRASVYGIVCGHIAAKCLFDANIRIDHPRSVSIGCRTQLEADVWLKTVNEKARLSIGDHCFIGRGAEIDIAEQVVIGNHVLIAPGVFITDHSHNIAAGILIDAQGCTSSSVVIGDDVWIGAKSVILPGVTIGDGAVIGAGAMVNRNVEAYTIVAGVPARVLRKRI